MKKKFKIKTLDKYINEALYNKKNGYYSTKKSFGKYGDFITNPKISILFSEILTVWIILFWKSINSPKNFNLIELGAGDGEMMYDIISTTKNYPEFAKSVNFYIFEKSNQLKKVQKKKLFKNKVKWINNFSEVRNCKSIIIGNEFLDSFPVKQLIKENQLWFEKCVKERKDKVEFIYKKADVKKYENKIGINLAYNQKFLEFSIEQIRFLKKLSMFLKKTGGGLLFIDYGYNNSRMRDTLQGIMNHKKCDVLSYKGKVDITHLINFNFLKKLLKKNNLKICKYNTQERFLKQMGIFERAEILAKNLSFRQKSDIFFRLKRLTDKQQMGELFKVMFASNEDTKFNYGFESDNIK